MSQFTTNYAYSSWKLCCGCIATIGLVTGSFMSKANFMTAMTSKEIQQVSLQQGIQGKVTRIGGNHMPSNIDQPETAGPEFIQTTIWIFAGQVAGTGSPRWSVADAQQHARLVRQVESDLDGCYSVELAPGEYTVFAQYDNALYLNAFQGNGSYKSVNVLPNQVLEMDLINSENALF